jgi:signal transduction histidine kinase
MSTKPDSLSVDPTISTSTNRTLSILPDHVWISLLDAVSDGISVHSASGDIVWANQRVCDIYSKPLSKLKGSSCQQVFHAEDTVCPHEQVLATGCVLQLEREMSLSGRILSVTIEPLFDERGATCGFLRLLHDVTDGQRAQKQLLKAERFAALGQLLAGIAHDAGTPLNVISGYCEFLLMRMKPDGQGYKELSAILLQTRRIASMLGDALDLARAPQGRTDAIEIKPLLAVALDLVGYNLREANVKADLTCRISPPLVYGEASQLRQAFFNLLLNAGQQVGTGGRLEVVIDEEPDRLGFLAISLWGTETGGVGHDFSRSLGGLLAEHSQAGPPGIGLSLAREILNEAGAKVSFSAVGGRGIQLMVYLPLNHGSRRGKISTV